MAGDGVMWARMAMAVPYKPEPGDEVLVICNEPPHAYVIGVLQGHGTTTLQVPADLRFEAPRGEVHILAGKAIQMRSDSGAGAGCAARTFRFVSAEPAGHDARAAPDQRVHLGNRPRSVQERAVARIAEESWFVRAGRAHVRTTDNIHITGKTLHLG